MIGVKSKSDVRVKVDKSVFVTTLFTGQEESHSSVYNFDLFYISCLSCIPEDPENLNNVGQEAGRDWCIQDTKMLGYGQ